MVSSAQRRSVLSLPDSLLRSSPRQCGRACGPQEERAASAASGAIPRKDRLVGHPGHNVRVQNQTAPELSDSCAAGSMNKNILGCFFFFFKLDLVQVESSVTCTVIDVSHLQQPRGLGENCHARGTEAVHFSEGQCCRALTKADLPHRQATPGGINRSNGEKERNAREGF